jgi:hypothetical protein
MVSTSTGHPIQDAHRAYVAAHAHADATPDIIDYCARLGDAELELRHLAERMSYAADCYAERAPVLRAHAEDVLRIQEMVTALVREALEA